MRKLKPYDSEQGTILKGFDSWPYSKNEHQSMLCKSIRNLVAVDKSGHRFTAGEFAPEYRQPLDFMYDTQAYEDKKNALFDSPKINTNFKDEPSQFVHPYPSEL